MPISIQSNARSRPMRGAPSVMASVEAVPLSRPCGTPPSTLTGGTKVRYSEVTSDSRSRCAVNSSPCPVLAVRAIEREADRAVG